jgi:hypothetical protein
MELCAGLAGSKRISAIVPVNEPFTVTPAFLILKVIFELLSFQLAGMKAASNRMMAAKLPATLNFMKIW